MNACKSITTFAHRALDRAEANEIYLGRKLRAYGWLAVALVLAPVAIWYEARTR